MAATSARLGQVTGLSEAGGSSRCSHCCSPLQAFSARCLTLVAQRSGETGIRISLGAQPDQVPRGVLADELRPARIGLLPVVVELPVPVALRIMTRA